MILLTLILAYSGHYLMARAELTRALWSNYPKWLDKWAMCPACSGTWTGFAFAWWINANGYSLSPLRDGEFVTWLIVGLLSMFTTPLLAYAHIYTLSMTSGDASE